MAGIYLHIPFCRQKCHYCNFYSTVSRKYKADFIPALLKEIEMQKAYLKDEVVSTIYFGGGTPSILECKEIRQLMEAMYKHYTIAGNAEITLEANPDDLSPEKLTELSLTPINRLSIGIQSFHDNDLKYLHRSHSADQAGEVIKNAWQQGFSNLSVDLIYGIPTLTNQAWIENLDIIIQSGIPHISAYCLTVEKGTALDVLIKNGKMQTVDEEKSARQFEILMNTMQKNAYLHYEISNFCKEGSVSQHNSNYWKQKPYLGLGPSAHSYNLSSRQWNLADISTYIASIRNNIVPSEIETLSLTQQYDEYILTGLRTIWGVNEMEILEKFGEPYLNYFRKNILRFIQKGWVQKEASVYFLSREGKYFADGIASDLFME